MIIEKAVERIRGRAVLFVEDRYKSGFLRMLLCENIPATVWENDENEKNRGLKAVISPKFTKNIISLLDKYSIKVYIINIEGYCAFIAALRKRAGALLGAALFFTVLWLSALFLWRVDVVGADTVSEERLRETLSELGVGVGVKISDIDAFSAANSLMVAHPEIAWASIQIKGTSATLTVRETVEHQGVRENGTSLLVASEGGIVQSVLVYKGASAVKVGSVVKAGDALINGLLSGSGLQYTDSPILRMGAADGSVTALVERELSVTVPYTETEYVPKENGRVLKRSRFTLFGAVFELGDDEPSDADAFSVSEEKTLPTVFGASLPVTVTETVWRELEPVLTERTAEEAEALARTRAEELLSEDTEGDELISAEYVVKHNEESGEVTVTVIYRCVTEIAVSANILK